MVQPGSALDCAMNCGWFDGDRCVAPVGAKCYYDILSTDAAAASEVKNSMVSS